MVRRLQKKLKGARRRKLRTASAGAQKIKRDEKIQGATSRLTKGKDTPWRDDRGTQERTQDRRTANRQKKERRQKETQSKKRKPQRPVQSVGLKKHESYYEKREKKPFNREKEGDVKTCSVVMTYHKGKGKRSKGPSLP